MFSFNFYPQKFIIVLAGGFVMLILKDSCVFKLVWKVSMLTYIGKWAIWCCCALFGRPWVRSSSISKYGFKQLTWNIGYWGKISVALLGIQKQYKNPTYKRYSAFSYMRDSRVPLLYYNNKIFKRYLRVQGIQMYLKVQDISKVPKGPRYSKGIKKSSKYPKGT